MRQRFEKFNTENPEVYKMLVFLARYVKDTGKQTYGMQSLFERLRWHYQFDTAAPEEFKLNNDYAAFYAREIMKQERDLAGFFVTRRSYRQS